jgi:hypothetical protein
MMIGYDIYDRLTMEHFPLCQSMILTTNFFFIHDSIYLGVTEIIFTYSD